MLQSRSKDGGRHHGSDQSVTGDEVSTRRLLMRYVATALVSLMVVAVATAFISRGVGTEEAIVDADRVAAFAAVAVVEPIVDDTLLQRDPDAIRTVDWAVRNQVLRGSLVRVKIWDDSGTILYSDESRLIGEQFDIDDDMAAVLRGEDVRAHVSDLAEPENRYEEQAVELLEVYQLIHTPDGTPVLFEAYFSYTGVDEAGRRAWLLFAPVILGALVLLEILQAPIALSLVRRLKRTQHQRETLLHQAMEATDTERRRIARDLHDGVVQDLAGVAFSLGASGRTLDGDVGADVRQAAEQVRDSVRALRSLLVEIYPPNLYEEGLQAAISDLMAKVASRGIATSLVVDAPVQALPTDQIQLVYRATQEGLRNVMRHADASRVEVKVTGDQDTICLEVSDDGRGIVHDEGAGQEGHMGLRTLADLALTFGATLEVSSLPGRGTVLALEVPVT